LERWTARRGFYFFSGLCVSRSFAFVGDDALIVPLSQLPPDFLIGVGATVPVALCLLRRFVLLLFGCKRVFCGAGCGVCNWGEAWQLRAAKRLRGGRLLFPLRRKK
jgi:hypothetical protein